MVVAGIDLNRLKPNAPVIYAPVQAAAYRHGFRDALRTVAAEVNSSPVPQTSPGAFSLVHDPSWEAFEKWVRSHYSNQGEILHVLNSYAWELWQRLGTPPAAPQNEGADDTAAFIADHIIGPGES